MWYGHGYGVWGWFFGTLMMLAFWGAVVWFVVRATSDRGPFTTRPTPEEILAERYARGDIDGDEYRRRLDELVAR